MGIFISLSEQCNTNFYIIAFLVRKLVYRQINQRNDSCSTANSSRAKTAAQLTDSRVQTLKHHYTPFLKFKDINLKIVSEERRKIFVYICNSTRLLLFCRHFENSELQLLSLCFKSAVLFLSDTHITLTDISQTVAYFCQFLQKIILFKLLSLIIDIAICRSRYDS